MRASVNDPKIAAVMGRPSSPTMARGGMTRDFLVYRHDRHDARTLLQHADSAMNGPRETAWKNVRSFTAELNGGAAVRRGMASRRCPEPDENVETERRLETLRDCRRDEVQGHLCRRAPLHGDIGVIVSEDQPMPASRAETKGDNRRDSAA